MRRKVFLLSMATLAISFAASAADWPQWGQNPQHTGEAQGVGQPARRMLQDIVYDPFAQQEQEETGGDLGVHYQEPLLDGDDVYMELKSGTFSGIEQWETQTWNEKRLHWENGALVVKWSFASDWKPMPYSFFATGPTWEPVFHPLLAGRYLYVPGAGGSLFKLDKLSGAVLARFKPFGPTLDPDLFLSGPLAADADGNVYYHATKLVHGSAWTEDAVGSWLVKVTRDGAVRTATYASLNPHAPAGGDTCPGTFGFDQLPWPPSPDAVAPTVPCGSQRPSLNSGIAIAPDGTLYTVTLAHFTPRTSFLLAVNPDLTPRWAASLRDRLHDGCNVLLPANGTPGGCRTGARDGVDPAENRPGAGRATDDSSSTPVVLPDGSVLFAAFTRFNYGQGHLMKFDARGHFLGAYPFGWDMTPTVWKHRGTYSILFKENRYNGFGPYCSGDETFCPSDRNVNNPAYAEGYFITQLASDLGVEWQYQNTNTESCTRQSDGSVSCVSDRPNSFEWCVNDAAVDRDGTVYANSEDGGLYAIRQGGTLKDHLFLQLAIGAAYTPLSIGADGKIYTQNDGHLFVVGR